MNLEESWFQSLQGFQRFERSMDADSTVPQGSSGSKNMRSPKLETLKTLKLRTSSARCPLLGRMAQASAFDQAVQVFGKIRCVIAGALECLRH